MAKAPETVSLAEIQEAARRASEEVRRWPAWKQALSYPRRFSIPRAKFREDVAHFATIAEGGAVIDVVDGGKVRFTLSSPASDER